jgi:anti-sigma-K factor RskA
MNYHNPKLQSLLAAEYVLGSLHGRARQRFEGLLSREPGLRVALEYWQNRLNPLAETLTPLQPPARVWKNIQNRIRYRQQRAAAGVWSNLSFWRACSAVSFAVIVSMSLALLQLRDDHQQALRYISVLHNEQAQPMMIASMTADGMLTIDMLQPYHEQPGQVMEVWSLPKAGQPVSLGLLNAKRVKFKLSAEQLQQLLQGQGMAISMEPEGGSPTGLPTGPVMYTGGVI